MLKGVERSARDGSEENAEESCERARAGSAQPVTSVRAQKRTSILLGHAFDALPDPRPQDEVKGAHDENPSPSHTLALNGTELFDKVRSKEASVEEYLSANSPCVASEQTNEGERTGWRSRPA